MFMCFSMKYKGFLMEIDDQNGAKINEKQSSNEKSLQSKKPGKNIVFSMLFGDLDSQNLIENHDLLYKKLSNKLSGFHSRI